MTERFWYGPPIVLGLVAATVAYGVMGLTWGADTPYWLLAIQLAILGIKGPNLALASRYQMISADIQASVPGGALYAIRTYFQVADSLPNRQEGALALFSAAVTFEEKLSDRGRAIQVLTMLVDRYPGTHMAETALAYRDVLVFENDESLLDKIHEWQTQESPPTP